jgi:hypothetical protein
MGQKQTSVPVIDESRFYDCSTAFSSTTLEAVIVGFRDERIMPFGHQSSNHIAGPIYLKYRIHDPNAASPRPSPNIVVIILPVFPRP